LDTFLRASIPSLRLRLWKVLHHHGLVLGHLDLMVSLGG